MLPDGASASVPWLQALSFEGLIFSCGFGAANLEDTDVGTFGAGGIDFTEHDLLVTMPANTNLIVIPIYFKPIFEAIGTIAAVDVLLASGAGGVISNGLTSATLVNTNMASANTTACTVGALGDAGGTAFTPANYIYREGGTHLTGVAGTGQTLMPEWSVLKSGVLHIVYGASKQVAGFVSAQASTGYIHYIQAELPSNAVI